MASTFAQMSLNDLKGTQTCSTFAQMNQNMSKEAQTSVNRPKSIQIRQFELK